MKEHKTLFQTEVLDSGFSKQQENFLIAMHESGVKRIELIVSKSIDARFVTFGFKTSDPLSIQQDMAHLSKMRKLVDGIANKAVMVIFAILISAVALIKFFIPTTKVGP